MIDFKEFVKKAVVFANVSTFLNSHNASLTARCVDSLEMSVLETAVIEKSWISGGLSGNDCYGHLNIVVEDEGEQDIVPEILGLLRSLGRDDVDSLSIKKMIQTHSFDEDSDYYFNYYTISKVYVSLKQLYDDYIVKSV